MVPLTAGVAVGRGVGASVGARVGSTTGVAVGVKVAVGTGVGVALALAALLPTGACVCEVEFALISEMMPMVKSKPALKPKAMPISSARQPVGGWRRGGGGSWVL